MNLSQQRPLDRSMVSTVVSSSAVDIGQLDLLPFLMVRESVIVGLEKVHGQGGACHYAYQNGENIIWQDEREWTDYEFKCDKKPLVLRPPSPRCARCLIRWRLGWVFESRESG